MLRSDRARHALVVAVAVILGVPGVARAQGGHVGPDEARLDAAKNLARRYEGLDVRWNLEAGTPARLRFAPGAALRGETPAECASRLLDEDLVSLLEPGTRTATSDELTPAVGSALVLRDTRDLGDGRFRVEFEQVSARTPVLDASVSVEVARTASGYEAVAVFAHYLPGVVAGGFSSEVEGALAARFPTYREGALEAKTSWTRVVAPVAGGHRSAFAVVATVKGECVRVLVDAQTGEELGRTSLTCTANVSGYCYEKDPGQTPLAAKPLAGLYVRQGATQVTTDAQGNHNLTGSVTIDTPGLSGPLLHVYVDGQRELAYAGAADAVLNFGDASYHTDEVAAWFHVTSYNAHFQQKYPGSGTAANVRTAVLVNSNFRNAFFSPSRITIEGETFPGYMKMGIFSGRSAARDATVIRHEYTHFLLNGLATLNGTAEAGGINEGLSDYFPCAQLESPLMGPYVNPPRLRTLENTLKWPADSMNGEVHRVGNIFNGALWQARKSAEAGKAGDRFKMDQDVWGGVLRFPRRPTLLDARDAIVQADMASNAGALKAQIEQAFFEHGIGPRPATPPAPPTPGGTPPAANQAPVLGAVTDQDVAVGGTLSVLLTATDPNADPVTIAASTLTGGSIQQMSTLPAQAMWTFKPTAAQLGVARVTFTVTDGMLSSSKTIAVRVLAAGTVPGTPAPATSGTTTPARGGSTVPASTAAKAAGGGGGGGGCELAATGTGDGLAYLPCGLALLALLLRRRSA